MNPVPDFVPKPTGWQAQDFQRVFVIVSLVAMFGFALVHEMVFNTDPQTKNLLIGALIGSFSTGAIQYLFGTSPQSAAKDNTIAQMATNTGVALLAEPPNPTPATTVPVEPPPPATGRGPRGA